MLAVIAAAACTRADARGRDGLRELTITAADYAFDVADTVTAGLTRIRLANKGKQFHHAQLVRLEEGKTLEDLMETIGRGAPTPSWITWVGGPEATALTSIGEATLALEPGNYAVICLIDSPDGVRHMAKGMARAIAVVPATGPMTEPRIDADMRLELKDYSFTFSPKLTRGTHMIRVQNSASQPHHVVFVKLHPGKTPFDAEQCNKMHRGPMPFELWGGITAISRGKTNVITVDFQKGTYLLVCFFPDAEDGRPHVVHGMERVVTVE
jgi:hypothetical protein